MYTTVSNAIYLTQRLQIHQEKTASRQDSQLPLRKGTPFLPCRCRLVSHIKRQLEPGTFCLPGPETIWKEPIASPPFAQQEMKCFLSAPLPHGIKC